ncbi:MAG: recombinase family protein [Phycisphaerales bacterium]|nr:recombinase family protein [Phycisphaerales bacterium]
MSTEHQQYSTENQRDAIAEFARARGYEIVKTYADDGKSGLSIEGRASLRQMLTDVESGAAPFRAILVYDVSRWGRFQDADESAYYEYVCKRAGIKVEYCMEQFANDGSPVSTIIKSVKRAMAGEYSRELSNKVFKGQCRLIQLGFRQGGPAGYGLRRMLLDVSGTPKGVLKRGEQKSLQTDRVILVPGPEEEVRTVQSIYEQFVKHGKSERTIADGLNASGVASGCDRPWTRSMVHQILANEKYIGNNVYNRVSFKLKKKRTVNPPDMWVRSDGAFDAIVEPESFFMARGIIQERNRHFTDDEMLARLKTLLAVHPELTGALIDETDGMPSSSAYRTRFGSLVNAYRLAGYTPERNFEYLEVNRQLRQAHPQLLGDMIQDLQTMGATVERDESSDVLVINGLYSASLYLARCRSTPAGSHRWRFRVPEERAADIHIIVRMDPANEQPTDYFLLPTLDIEMPEFRLAEFNGASIDTFKFESLEFFFGMAKVVQIEVAA